MGIPGANVMAGMEREFCHSEDSQDTFTTSTYGTKTTPPDEYSFVVKPDLARDYGGGRTSTPLACFLYATSATKQSSDTEAHDTALEELGEETRDGVKTALMRRVKEEGLTTTFLGCGARREAGAVVQVCEGEAGESPRGSE